VVGFIVEVDVVERGMWVLLGFGFLIAGGGGASELIECREEKATRN